MMNIVISALLFTAVVTAQPLNIPARTTRAVTLVGNNIYLYGGKNTGNIKQGGRGGSFSISFSFLFFFPSLSFFFSEINRGEKKENMIKVGREW